MYTFERNLICLVTSHLPSLKQTPLLQQGDPKSLEIFNRSKNLVENERITLMCTKHWVSLISNFKFPGHRLLGFFICQTTAHKISLEMKELFFLDFKWHDTAVLPVKNSPRRVI